MSPFTADAKVLEHVLGNDGGVWKEMRGRIQSIRIFDRVESESKAQVNKFKVEIQTDGAGADAKPSGSPMRCIGIFGVEATWDFMSLKGVDVKKISLDCQ